MFETVTAFGSGPIRVTSILGSQTTTVVVVVVVGAIVVVVVVGATVVVVVVGANVVVVVVIEQETGSYGACTSKQYSHSVFTATIFIQAALKL